MRKLRSSRIASDINEKAIAAELLSSLLGDSASAKQREAFDKLKDALEVVRQGLDSADRFNAQMSSRGWIASDTMSNTLRMEVLALAEAGSIAQAESKLVQAFGPEEVRKRMGSLNGNVVFKRRIPLLKLAYADYEAGRYHACIPVVLMMVDGIAAEVTAKRKGAFDRESDLFQEDSVVGHGLPVLKELLVEKKNQTSAAEQSVPFRHGILHGRLLGYANVVVAAKTWALLFCVRDWVEAIERKRSRKS